jgi:hypothetical protein
MAATVTFVYMGPPEQKHVAKIGPMATLRGALADAAAKWRPPVDASTASVLLAKKPVDLDTPFRLLNIPAGSRLDVVRGGRGWAARRGGEDASWKTPGPRPCAAARGVQTVAGCGPSR